MNEFLGWNLSTKFYHVVQSQVSSTIDAQIDRAVEPYRVINWSLSPLVEDAVREEIQNAHPTD